MDFLQIGKDELELNGYAQTEDSLVFNVKTANAGTLMEEFQKSDTLTVKRYAENSGRKGDLYVSEQHYGFKPKDIVTNYASGETMITMARPTITIKGVADIDRVMSILEDAGYKVEEKAELKK